jgi:hypothetical protein
MSDTESEAEVDQRQARIPESSTMSNPNTVPVAPQIVGSIHSSHLTTIPEAYHLTGIENYGSWAFRMKNIL